MNWFTRKPAATTTTTAQALRRNHIEILKKVVPGVAEVRAGVMFDAPCDSGGKVYNVRITLPPAFPSAPPQIEIMPSVIHPWVNAYDQVVGHPKLSPAVWSSHTSLGNVVLEVIQQLQAVPPTLKSAAAAAASTHMPSASTGPPQYAPAAPQPGPPAPSGGGYGFAPGVQAGGRSSGGGPGAGSSAASAVPRTPMPAIPSSFPQLARMSMTELEELLGDDAAFDDFFNGLEDVRSLRDIRVELKESNKALAAANLELEEELNVLKVAVGEQHEAYERSRAEFAHLQARQRELQSRFSPAALRGGLLAAAQTVDRDSEALAASFMDSDTSLSDFVSAYLDMRKLYHTRAAKAERMR